MQEARALGALQIGFSGGEPLVRQDLETLISEAKNLGYYSNLITSSIGMDANRLAGLQKAGLDHIQISFQGADKELNDKLAANTSFDHKIAMTQEAKKLGFPMVLNFVLHRYNIHQVELMLNLSLELEADFVELANCQYYGWALHNRGLLLPSREQLQEAEQITNTFRDTKAGNMRVLFVVPDYYEDRPKLCSNGWGTTFLTVTPNGDALPCQGAKELPGIVFPSVLTQSISEIWKESDLFNHFRGDEWMQEPCRSCPEKEKDYGGCRCQAYLLTGDKYATDPICSLAPEHHRIEDFIDKSALTFNESMTDNINKLTYRNPKNYKNLIASDRPTLK